MAATREPGLNSGLPDHDGLDEGTKQRLLAAANKSGKGVLVGGTQDVQKFFGELAKDANEPTVNIPPGEDESSPTSMEHDAIKGDAVTAVGGGYDDSYTVDELKDALAAKGEPTSGNKDELIERLNK